MMRPVSVTDGAMAGRPHLLELSGAGPGQMSDNDSFHQSHYSLSTSESRHPALATSSAPTALAEW